MILLIHGGIIIHTLMSFGKENKSVLMEIKLIYKLMDILMIILFSLVIIIHIGIIKKLILFLA
jgi:hypothetical protein